MSVLTYRKVLSAKDIAAVARLAQGIWREHYETLLGTGQTAYMLALYQSEGAISRQILNGDIYKLCIAEGRLIGYYSIRRQKNVMELGRIYIKREERGKKYARQILEDVLSQCDGCTEIRLAVEKVNVSAVAAYRKLGFEICGERDADIGAGYRISDYLMRMPLFPEEKQPQHSA